jgi:2,3-bisphosphoglycerate-dependent phosphoglycerate mutase
MTLFLIRHAQSANNDLYERTAATTGRVEDPELTALGTRQAEILAEYLSRNGGAGGEFRFTHLYTSLMVRAVATAAEVSRTCGLPMIAWQEVHERMGIFLEDEKTGEMIGRPGNSRSYFQKHYPTLLLPDTLDDHGWWNRPAETESQWKQRARDFICELRRRHAGGEDRVAVVTHGGFYHEVLLALIGAGGQSGVWFTMHNTGITRLEFHAEYISLVYHNRLEHLPPQMVS